ncbi:hypothetical protein ACFVRV_06220 [Arthrobacter koreensis]|uniref:hypothetical protein n=1 Tax=Arthrobacter koreensis TaxID=199136 RepID=UPI0036DA1781
MKFSINLPLTAWETSSVDLVWVEPPTRLQKEVRIPLDPRLHMDRPEVTQEVTDPETGVVSRVVVDPATLV